MTAGRGNLSGHFVEHLEGLMTRWAKAVETLPDRELTEQRDALREVCVDVIGAKPEALVLKVLNAELRRREDRPR